MNFTFHVVDAFVDPEKPFSGNPAAVILLADDTDLEEASKIAIAGQFNYSATVFVSGWNDQPNHFVIRWFTGVNELELCGHGTVAATHVLCNEPNRYSEVIDKSKPIRYRTNFGAILEANLDGQFINLNFPLNESSPVDAFKYTWLRELQKAVLGHNTDQYIEEAELCPNQYLLLRISEHIPIEQVLPDFGEMVRIDNQKLVKLVIVTQKADYSKDGAHFLSRIFSPWQGINEDPACGSACTVLAPYWDKQLAQDHVRPYHMKQLSKRGALITIQRTENRVRIAGLSRLFSSGVFQF